MGAGASLIPTVLPSTESDLTRSTLSFGRSFGLNAVDTGLDADGVCHDLVVASEEKKFASPSLRSPWGDNQRRLAGRRVTRL